MPKHNGHSKKNKKGGGCTHSSCASSAVFTPQSKDELIRAVNSLNSIGQGDEQYGPIEDWNVSNVTDMSELFKNNINFNNDISMWNVSAVTDMSWMFYGAVKFNQPIGNWNVSNVTNMESMFQCARVFNQPINDWKVGNVTTMKKMFSGAHAFDQPINDWNVSSVTNMMHMFSGARMFNQPLEQWNVANVTNMSYMFAGAYAFNQDLSKWEVSHHKVYNEESHYISRTRTTAAADDAADGMKNTRPITNMTQMFSETLPGDEDRRPSVQKSLLGREEQRNAFEESNRGESLPEEVLADILGRVGGKTLKKIRKIKKTKKKKKKKNKEKRKTKSRR